MQFNNKDYIIFVTFINIYKYYVLSFDLINKSFNYQYYINNVLFKYLNQFCQTYLNNILIYSKIKKKHVKHVRLILIKLQTTNLLINIKKYEFYVKETTFLKILLLTNEIRINSRKI